MGATKTMKTEKCLVPTLRFKEFDGNWNNKQLKEVCSFFSGGTPTSSNKEYYNGDIPFIGSGNIFDSKVSNYITEEALNSSSAKIVEVGDLLYALYGANSGEVGISKMSGAINQAILCIRTETEKIEFIHCLLVLNKDKIVGKYLQGGQGNLSANIVKKLKYHFPTLAEQQKIAAFLTAVDEKIQQLSKKKALLEQYKKGVMQQLFSGQLRFKPALNGVERDDNGEAYPDWEEKKLGEVAEKVNKKNKDNSVNYVLTNSATQGIVSQSDYFDRDIANQNNLEGYYVVKVNDFVYNPRISVHAPVGPVKRNKLKEGVMSPLYTVFRFYNVDLIYIECFFSTIVWHKYLNSVANFGARYDRMNISQQDFFKMPIPFPCVEEQQKIATYLSSVDTKIENVTNQITQTQTYKRGLLQKLFV